MSGHITQEQFQRLLAGHVTADEQQAIEAHVEACHECEDELTRLTDELQMNAGSAGAPWQHAFPMMPDEDPAQGFLRRIKAKLPVLRSPMLDSRPDTDEADIEFPGPPTARGRLGQLECYHIDEE